MYSLSPLTDSRPGPCLVDRNNAKELYFRMQSVAILTRRGTHFHVFEAQYSNRLFRELRRVARSGETICGMVTDRGALDHSSIHALNAYLRYNRGVKWPDRLTKNPTDSGVHRWAWKSFLELLALRFVN